MTRQEYNEHKASVIKEIESLEFLINMWHDTYTIYKDDLGEFLNEVIEGKVFDELNEQLKHLKKVSPKWFAEWELEVQEYENKQ